MTTTENAPARGTRAPYAKSKARRAQILRRAYEAFAVQGFTGTSMREIALAVGLSHQAIYHHFDSKESLLTAVLQEKDRESTEVLARAASLSLRDALINLVEHNLEQPALVRLYTTLGAESTNPSHPAHEYFRTRYARARALAAAKIAEGQAAGTLRADIDVTQSAAVVIAVMDGLQVQWLLDEQFDVVAAMDEHLRVALLAPARADDTI